MNKRQRGRGRKNNNNNNNNPNRSLDSNGPDVKIRGSANTIYDKYTTLARDAASSGHRVKAENYLQHAEHYLRLLTEQQAKAAEQKAAQELARQQNSEKSEQDDIEGDDQNRGNGRTRRYPPRRRQPDQNDAQDNKTNGQDAGSVKESGEAKKATPKDADAAPKKTRRKKPVEVAVEAPPEESITTAAE